MRCFLRLSENILLPWTRRRCLQASRKGGQPAFSALPCGGPACQRVLETSFRPPLEICSDQKVGLATPGQRRVPLLSGLPAAFAIPPSDPVCPLPSTSRGSPLAQNKSDPLILHGSQYPPLEYYFPHAHPYLSTPVSPVSLLLLKHARHICTPGPLHLLIPLPEGSYLARSLNTGVSPLSPCQRPSLPRYSRGPSVSALPLLTFSFVTVLITTQYYKVLGMTRCPASVTSLPTPPLLSSPD